MATSTLENAAAPFVKPEQFADWEAQHWETAQREFGHAVDNANSQELAQFILSMKEAETFNLPVEPMTAAYERAVESTPTSAELLRRFGTHLLCHYSSRDDEGHQLLARAAALTAP